jgi:tetratricopeptide (TPR) repeat protein
MMIRHTLILIAVIIQLMSCVSDADDKDLSCAERLVAIKSMESGLRFDSEIDTLKVKDLIKTYAKFSNSCPNDSLTPEFLTRRADLLRGIGKTREAIKQLLYVHDGFPNYDRSVMCAFLVGYIYENELGDDEMAEKMYKNVIELYPDSREAEISRQSIKHLGISPEDVVKSFQKNK